MENVTEVVDPVLDVSKVEAEVEVQTAAEVNVNLDPHEEYLVAVGDAEMIRNGRPVNEIPLSDDYWGARNKATALFSNVKK